MNKFEFSIMALNIDIYFVFIVFFIVFFFFAFEQYYYIKLCQLCFNNNKDEYFCYIIIINYKKVTVNAYTYSYKIVTNNI